MKVSRALIEKYHEGKCSPEEIRVVEEWLFDDESAEPLSLPETDKDDLKAEMWQDISTVLPPQRPIYQLPVFRYAAAMLLAAGLGALAYVASRPASPVSPDIVRISNASDTFNKDLHLTEYSLSIAPQSNVKIDHEKGSIDFCGAMLINPKRDLEFVIQGNCPADRGNEKVSLKKGQNYIAVNYSNSSQPGELIILQQGALNGLPPWIQRQLMAQFNI